MGRIREMPERSGTGKHMQERTGIRETSVNRYSKESICQIGKARACAM